MFALPLQRRLGGRLGQFGSEPLLLGHTLNLRIWEPSPIPGRFTRFATGRSLMQPADLHQSTSALSGSAMTGSFGTLGAENVLAIANASARKRQLVACSSGYLVASRLQEIELLIQPRPRQ